MQPRRPSFHAVTTTLARARWGRYKGCGSSHRHSLRAITLLLALLLEPLERRPISFVAFVFAAGWQGWDVALTTTRTNASGLTVPARCCGRPRHWVRRDTPIWLRFADLPPKICFCGSRLPCCGTCCRRQPCCHVHKHWRWTSMLDPCIISLARALGRWPQANDALVQALNAQGESFQN